MTTSDQFYIGDHVSIVNPGGPLHRVTGMIIDFTDFVDHATAIVLLDGTNLTVNAPPKLPQARQDRRGGVSVTGLEFLYEKKWTNETWPDNYQHRPKTQQCPPAYRDNRTTTPAAPGPPLNIHNRATRPLWRRWQWRRSRR